ncbi:MAG: hypothetical protein ACK5O7_06435 [Holosporales bacterium]
MHSSTFCLLTALISGFLNTAHASSTSNVWEYMTAATDDSSRSTTPHSASSDRDSMDVDDSPQGTESAYLNDYEENFTPNAPEIELGILSGDDQASSNPYAPADDDHIIGARPEPLARLVSMTFDFIPKTTDVTSQHYARWLANYLPSPIFNRDEWQGLSLLPELKTYGDVCAIVPGALMGFDSKSREKIFELVRQHTLIAMNLAHERIVSLQQKSTLSSEEHGQWTNSIRLHEKAMWYHALNSVVFYDVQVMAHRTEEQKQHVKLIYWTHIKTWLSEQNFTSEQKFRLLITGLSHTWSEDDYFGSVDIKESCALIMRDQNLPSAGRAALAVLLSLKFYKKVPYLLHSALGMDAKRLLSSDKEASLSFVRATIATLAERKDKDALNAIQNLIGSWHLSPQGWQELEPVLIQLQNLPLLKNRRQPQDQAIVDEDDDNFSFFN